ncbi:MAG: AsmA family protein, partial [Dehalococcoidia bacterium]|nr:AsmA family protein [Dehalococcoidia bacterium]
MKKTIKWISISLGGLIIVVTLVLLIAPRFIDIRKYKPEIEKLVTEATGRPFTLAGDLKLSLFPVAVLSFSDLHLGNPEGFREKDFIAIKSFDARVKLLPLISRDIQIMRFVVEGPRIVLEKR